jgi:hypothetical protein
MTASTTNWNLFWQHHLGSWIGRWTRYSQTGEIQETFKSTRSFSANPDRTEINQINQQNFANGDTNTMQWNYSIHEHSHNDGFAHPASSLMRGLAFENGAAAWLVPQLQHNQYQAFELFLMQKNVRHSVGVLYGENGQLLHTASIREYRGEPSNNIWSIDIDQMNPWTIDGKWQGEKLQINPNLDRHPIQPIQWQWNLDEPDINQTNHFFPDKIILRCPTKLMQGEAFNITVYWQTKDDQLQIIRANYNQAAQLNALSQQTMHRPTGQSQLNKSPEKRPTTILN